MHRKRKAYAPGPWGIYTCFRVFLAGPFLLALEHNITDAEAYLLERKGDIGAALDLILRTIDKCFETLKGKLRRLVFCCRKPYNFTRWAF